MWSALSRLPRSIESSAIACRGDTAWVAGAQTVTVDPYLVVPGIAHSRDGGLSWLDSEQVRLDVNLWMQFAAVAAYGSDSAWVAGTRYRPPSGEGVPWVIATSDGGATWHVQVLPTEQEGDLTAISFADGAVGVVGGASGDPLRSRGGQIFFTTDGGARWQVAALPAGIAAIHALQLVRD